jgi:hypothetical protein
MIRTVMRYRLSAVFGIICLALWFYEFGPTSLWSWFTLVSYLAAVVVFLFVARAYIAPYVVMRFSKHLHVRSISLRSIRGLYFRRGNRTWHVERIGYSYRSSGEGKPKGILLKIQGLRIEIAHVSREQPARTKHRRRITLVDLSPSPLALHLWSIMSTVYWVFDPIIRPVIRISVTSILNQVIHRIPILTQALRLELESAVIVHAAIPDAQLVIAGADLDAHLTFSYLHVPVPHSDQINGQGGHRPSAAALAMGAWKSRLAMGFKRTWRHAWDSTLGQTKASLTFDLMINKVIGDTPIHSEHSWLESTNDIDTLISRSSGWRTNHISFRDSNSPWSCSIQSKGREDRSGECRGYFARSECPCLNRPLAIYPCDNRQPESKEHTISCLNLADIASFASKSYAFERKQFCSMCL